MTADLAYISRNSSYKRKTIVMSEDKYFNYHKIEYYRNDCKYLDYRLLTRKKAIVISNKIVIVTTHQKLDKTIMLRLIKQISQPISKTKTLILSHSAQERPL